MTADNAVRARATALVLTDLQLAIISGTPLAPSEPDAVMRFNGVVECCAKALAAARRLGMLMVHVRVAFSQGYPEANPSSPMMRFIREKGLLIDGDPGTAFSPKVRPAAGEIVITKHGVSAFAGTPLDQILRARNISAVALCGLVTHYAVDSTAREAHDRGYGVIVLKDGCASGAPARHEATLANLAFLGSVVTTEEFISSIECA